MINKIKRFLVRSPLHKPALELKALRISNRWVKENAKILDHRTVYCISPYKTATTFLASCFDRTISKHEPLHHTSVRKLNQDFNRFFVRRLNSLNLKLECSGFLSAYVEELAQNEVAKDLTYVCVLRKPSSWVTSVVNHHQIVKGYGQHYFWGNELFWKKHAGVDLANFFNYDESEKLELIEKLIAFYFSFTRKTEKLQHVKYVWIKDLQGFLPSLGQLIGEEPKLEDSKKNKAQLRKYVYENNEVDAAYEKLIGEILTLR